MDYLFRPEDNGYPDMSFYSFSMQYELVLKLTLKRSREQTRDDESEDEQEDAGEIYASHIVDWEFLMNTI